MKILLVEKNKMTRPLYLLLEGISEGLCIKIYNKFQSFVQYGDLYHTKHHIFKQKAKASPLTKIARM